MWHPDPKSIITSRTAWSASLAIAAGIATLALGHEVKVDDVAGIPADQLAGDLAAVGSALYASGGAAAIGGLMAFVFRVLAKRPLTLTGAPAAPSSDMARAEEIARGTVALEAGPAKPSAARRSATLPAGALLALVMLAGCQPLPTSAGTDVNALVDACREWSATLEDATRAIRAGTIALPDANDIGQLNAGVQPICQQTTTATPAKVAAVRQATAQARRMTSGQ